MKIAVIDHKDPKTGEPVYQRHADGDHKGEVVMRDETRDETMSRLRVKNEIDAGSADPYIAAQARENLDWLSLIDGGASGTPFDPAPLLDRFDRVESALTKLDERVVKIEVNRAVEG